jgi:hypothetical protein
LKTSGIIAFSFAIGLSSIASAPGTPSPQHHTVAWVHHAVSQNAQAQAAFDRGLLDYYAYNPEAAEHEFYTAADLDRHLAMAYWGIALSNAPNLNVDRTDDRAAQAREAIEQSKTLEQYASVEDRALIDAAVARFDDTSKKPAAVLLVNYRDALQKIAAAYPNDPDAATLYLESALYVAVGDESDDSAAARAARAANSAALLPVFQSSLARFPNEVGLLHFYIHAAQIAGRSPEAVTAATQLAAFTFRPEDSHLTHMPGHTFFDVGMYDAALDVAKRSVAMDYADFACCHPGYYSGPRYYHGHNVSFLLYALIETGHLTQAVAAARREDDPYFLAIALVAAHDWQAVLSVPYAKGKSRTIAFARGLAYAKLGDPANAETALNEIPNAAPGSPYAVAIVDATRLTLSGEIAAARHDDATALALLTQASAAAVKAQKNGGTEFPALYYYSPHMALAELAVRLGKLDIARAALHAELDASPRSPSALNALAQLGAASR